uniref:Mitochondrial pyruvate carrier n=1 Tax=Phallusia mammillata TaxID=59560 RepID=A0A6F9DKF2_9ASCI|nr:mitochondrial pyruvate carrier 2-like [Phallusia mammillata]
MSVAIRRVLLRWDNKIQTRLSPAFREKWNHPAGPKTIHFWCPVCKWGLVFAGMSDLARPVENLSLNQSASLMLTGFIWTRYCFVIIPKNYFLASCNLFLGLTGLTQAVRVAQYKLNKKEED